MKKIIDRLAILNLQDNSNLIEEAKKVEPENNISSIKIIISEPNTEVLLKYHNKEIKEVKSNSTNLFIDCKTISEAIVEKSTSLLIEYTTEG